MNGKVKGIVLLLIVLVISFSQCKKKEKHMEDMYNIAPDGSHDDRYIFRKEIEEEKKRNEKSKSPEF